jgi:6-phosphofructokinase 1
LVATGQLNRLVVWKAGRLDSLPLRQVAGRIKTVPRNHPLLLAAKAVNTSFGE